jgi:hypothetical protein
LGVSRKEASHLAIAAYIRKIDGREGIEAEATSMEDGELVKRETRDDEEDVGRAGTSGKKAHALHSLFAIKGINMRLIHPFRLNTHTTLIS